MGKLYLILAGFLSSSLTYILGLKHFFTFIFKVSPKIIKWGFFIFVFNLISLIIIYGIYHIYYGSSIILSHFVNIYTLNILHSTFVGLVIYKIYYTLYSND